MRPFGISSQKGGQGGRVPSACKRPGQSFCGVAEVGGEKWLRAITHSLSNCFGAKRESLRYTLIRWTGVRELWGLRPRQGNTSAGLHPASRPHKRRCWQPFFPIPENGRQSTQVDMWKREREESCVICQKCRSCNTWRSPLHMSFPCFLRLILSQGFTWSAPILHYSHIGAKRY